MVRYLAFVLVGLVSIAQTARASSGEEEQRKYVPPPTTDEAQIRAMMSRPLDGFAFEPHSTFKTVDIYFDTPDWDMKKHGYSLRIRRAEKTTGVFEYSIQLKSEMAEPGEVRMEVEHKDLTLQRVSLGEKLGPLISVVERVIAEGSATAPELATALGGWMEKKMGSSLAPFQELSKRGFAGKAFRPVLIGHDERLRFHIYVDRRAAHGEMAGVQASMRHVEGVPVFFTAEPARVWLMEGSWDRATFRPLLGTAAKQSAPFAIAELEIENKYRPRASGTLLLDRLEKDLREDWKVSPGLASKYLQAASRFY